MPTIRYPLLAAVLLAGVSNATIAHAQARPAELGATGADDIIVTARKRDERLQDVPVAISVLSQEDINRYDTSSIAQVASQTPSFVVGGTSGATGGVINLRGIGSPVSSASIDQSVSINLDGVQVSQANVLTLGLQDAARIEILKGPQALFFGKNSPGGIVSIISADPSRSFEGALRGGYEFAAAKRFVEGVISTPLTPEIGLRVAAYYSNERGYYYNDARPIPSTIAPDYLGGATTPPGVGTTEPRGPHQRQFVTRGTLKYQSSEGSFDASLKLAYSSQDRKAGITYGQIYACAGAAPGLVLLLNSAGSRDCKLDETANEEDDPPAAPALTPLLRDGRAYYETEQFLSSLTANYRPSDELTLT